MRVNQVKYVNEYKLNILFSDKKTKVVDLADIVKKGGYYFDPLKDIEFFKQVSLDDEEYPLSIRWPNDADICPDVLYEMGKEIESEKDQSFEVKMLHIVERVEHIKKYKLKLFFNDGKIKIVDFEDRLKEAKNMFLPLKNVDYFKQVKADGTTIVWPNGLDLCPDVLYEIGKEIEMEKEPSPKKTSQKKNGTKKREIKHKISAYALGVTRLKKNKE